jgi:hypothetical protein
LKKIIFLFTLVLVSVISINEAFAVDFVDRTGYIPEWAKEMGLQQALMACQNVEYKTPDDNWCMEFSGYALDQANQELEKQEQNLNETVTEFDEQEYEPEYNPQFNANLFPDSKPISPNTYVNNLYNF